MSKVDTLVFIGRFQPFHNGHKAVIDQALKQAREVVICIGSAFQPRSIKNPFTFEERRAMIQAEFSSYNGYNPSRLKIMGIMDRPYDDSAWVSSVQSTVDSVREGETVGLIGHSKDSSSFYLKIFPKWNHHIEVDNVDDINATDIRQELCERDYSLNDVPHHTKLYILEWVSKNHDIRESIFIYEYNKIKRYKEDSAMTGFNFPSVFVTTDAVLTQSGHILLIKRGDFPFKDCWALPGGYLDSGVSIRDNMVKELREETCIKVPAKVLYGSIRGVDIFDMPERDPRGRTITHGFHIDMGFPDIGLPKVKGGDDAKEAKWWPLGDVTSEMMAFDHYAIISNFIRM